MATLYAAASASLTAPLTVIARSAEGVTLALDSGIALLEAGHAQATLFRDTTIATLKAESGNKIARAGIAARIDHLRFMQETERELARMGITEAEWNATTTLFGTNP